MAGNSTTSLEEMTGGAWARIFLPIPSFPLPTTWYTFREGSPAEEKETRKHGWRDAVGKGDLPQNTEKIDVGIVD